jgi:hypothetical protein
MLLETIRENNDDTICDSIKQLMKRPVNGQLNMNNIDEGIKLAGKSGRFREQDVLESLRMQGKLQKLLPALPTDIHQEVRQTITIPIVSSADRLKSFLQGLKVPSENIADAIDALFSIRTTEITKKEELSALSKYLKDNRENFETPNFFLDKIPDISGHFLANSMMIRSHYINIARLAGKHGKSGTILICGDPGVGKSLFSLYMFFFLVIRNEPVIRVSQGGAAIYFDPDAAEDNKFRFEPSFNTANTEWLSSKWWLLLDGRGVQIPFVDKKRRTILFASPRKENYNEFIKNRGISLFLPPWDDQEVIYFL